MIKNNVKRFRQIGMIEGYSFLILLFIAMPIKYILGYPIAVKIVGMTHGILFIVFCLLLAKAWYDARWSFKESTLFFVASLVPFGTFFTDKKIKVYE
jgi:integral membrane protein